MVRRFFRRFVGRLRRVLPRSSPSPKRSLAELVAAFKAFEESEIVNLVYSRDEPMVPLYVCVTGMKETIGGKSNAAFDDGYGVNRKTKCKGENAIYDNQLEMRVFRRVWRRIRRLIFSKSPSAPGNVAEPVSPVQVTEQSLRTKEEN